MVDGNGREGRSFMVVFQDCGLVKKLTPSEEQEATLLWKKPYSTESLYFCRFLLGCHSVLTSVGVSPKLVLGVPAHEQAGDGDGEGGV